MYLRTDKYVRRNQSTSNRSEVKRILMDKAQQNAVRRRNLKFIADKLLANATVYMNGSKREMGQTSDGKTRVVNAFQDLVKTVYSSLRMLGNTQFSEDTIKNVIRSRQDDLFGTDDNTISEAETEVLNFIQRRKKNSDRTTLNDLKTHFTRRPYGWYQNAIWTVTAKLYKRGKIEVRKDSNLLDDEDVLNALLNSSNYGNTLLEPQAVIDPKLVKALKQVYADAFDESCDYKEAKEVANAFKEKLNQMSVEVNQLLAQKREYPFLNSLEEFAEKLQRWGNKDYSFYLTKLNEFEDDLLDAKEDLLDPIKRFMNGEQRKIYDSIKNLVTSNTANIDYVEGDEFDTLKTLIESKTPYLGNAIQIAKAAKDSLVKKISETIEKEKKEAVAVIKKIINDFKQKEEFKDLDDDQQSSIIKPFDDVIDKLQQQRFIAVIRDLTNNAKQKLYPEQLNEMIRLSSPEPQNETSGKESIASEPKPHYITMANIKPDYPKSELRTEKDVDEYIEAYRKKLLEHIKNNRRISI